VPFDARSRVTPLPWYALAGSKETALTNNLLTGWNFWLKEGDRYRHFSVAENDRAEAEKIALARAPNAEIVSQNELPHSVIQFLKTKRGQMLEWFPADPSEPSEPPSVKARKARHTDRS
jgi:hypothetical protein